MKYPRYLEYVQFEFDEDRDVRKGVRRDNEIDWERDNRKGG